MVPKIWRKVTIAIFIDRASHDFRRHVRLLAIERLKIKTTFTFDAHFKEYGKFNISP